MLQLLTETNQTPFLMEDLDETPSTGEPLTEASPETGLALENSGEPLCEEPKCKEDQSQGKFIEVSDPMVRVTRVIRMVGPASWVHTVLNRSWVNPGGGGLRGPQKSVMEIQRTWEEI